jgi:hypothetical protein
MRKKGELAVARTHVERVHVCSGRVALSKASVLATDIADSNASQWHGDVTWCDSPALLWSKTHRTSAVPSLAPADRDSVKFSGTTFASPLFIILSVPAHFSSATGSGQGVTTAAAAAEAVAMAVAAQTPTHVRGHRYRPMVHMENDLKSVLQTRSAIEPPRTCTHVHVPNLRKIPVQRLMTLDVILNRCRPPSTLCVCVGVVSLLVASAVGLGKSIRCNHLCSNVLNFSLQL